jgi:hypothetical protein
MGNSAEGILGEAIVYKGIVRKMVAITVVNEKNTPITRARFAVSFDGQIVRTESDNKGVLKVPIKIKGKVKVECLESNSVLVMY